jgi:hypothetical protein
MTSALASVANASCAFSLPAAGTTVDAATGNVLPASETVTVSLYLRQGSRSGANFPGVDTDTVTFEGYAVSPQALDARIRPGVRGSLTFAGQAAVRCEVIQERFPYGSTGVIGGTLQRVLGDRIRLTTYIDG